MHLRVRVCGKPDAIIVVPSKLTKIKQFRLLVQDKFGVPPKLQRLIYGGKLLEDEYTFHDYNIRLNDVVQLLERSEPQNKEPEPDISKNNETKSNIQYTDATSVLYAIGDLVDVRDNEGYWLEGKIIRILDQKESTNMSPQETEINNGAEVDSCKNDSTTIPNVISSQELDVKFIKLTKDDVDKFGEPQNLLYKIQLDADVLDSELECSLEHIRPRSRREIDIDHLQVGQMVMINHNIRRPWEKGNWYDFKIDEIKRHPDYTELFGILYLGDNEPRVDTTVRLHDVIYAIEEVVPIAERTNEYSEMMLTQPKKRTEPLKCLKCRDDADKPCKSCGCYLCAGKEEPETIILCDECDRGYHMHCIKPPLIEVPEEDWYCSFCKRDPNEVVAPGAAKQMKKTSLTNSSRDWGRGMACVGKTRTCAMPTNHFGPIPGIEVGMIWRFRIQVSESGVHRPPVSGIHGRDVEGAYSIVLSGGYEDDVDNGIEFTYSGSGGRDLSGNKRTAGQSMDQTLTRENKALARNCAVKEICEDGADAGANWRDGKPVRVVRSYKMLKHFPKYAPKEGIRYDGIYKVVKYYPESGLSGYRVWKYLLRRDDPSPAPWQKNAKQFSMIYPDGYLEAEAEKKALKEKNKGNKNTNSTKRGRKSRASKHSESVDSPPSKKRKASPSNRGASTSKQKKAANLKKKGKDKSLTDASETEEEDSPKCPEETESKKANGPGNSVDGEPSTSAESEAEVSPEAKNKNTKKSRGKPGAKSSSGTSKVIKAASVFSLRTPKGKLANMLIAEAEQAGHNDSPMPDGDVKSAEKGGDISENAEEPNKGAKEEASTSPDSGRAKKKTKVSPLGKKKKTEVSPPTKKKKTEIKKRKAEVNGGKSLVNMTATIPYMFKMKSPQGKPSLLTHKEKDILKKDSLNSKLWDECMSICEEKGKKEFVDHVTQVFLCIICQDLPVMPVTTTCLHNFCMACLKLAFKSTTSQSCPCCRNDLMEYEPTVNQDLKAALQTVMPGYDVGKK